MNKNIIDLLNKHEEGVEDDILILTTYDQDYEEDEDSRPITFAMPLEWARELIKRMFETTIEDYLAEYIWDSSEVVYLIAKDEDKILGVTNN